VNFDDRDGLAMILASLYQSIARAAGLDW
jgi:hypothetical protein